MAARPDVETSGRAAQRVDQPLLVLDRVTG